MEIINTVLSGYIMPLMLMGAGVYFGWRMKFFYLFHPIRFIKSLSENRGKSGISPFRALTEALAGTLGVGNMTGVATAICAGGSGALFWMWVSAFFAMSIKYFEVALGVRYRRREKDGYAGGAMYYIKDMLSKRSSGAGGFFGSFFAFLCIGNSLLTGNIVQMNSAAAAADSFPPLLLGGICAVLSLPVVLGKAKKISAVTSFLIPFLSGLYIVLSLIVIIPSIDRLPAVGTDILKNAFSVRAAGGGIGGFLIMRAIRFGTTRGILSNEAGSGTSPTAHAGADAKSPHHQGCFGIFEVFFDTTVLCTLTGAVILLSDGCQRGYDGMELTVYSFSSQAGSFAGVAVSISALLFAYATVICQTGYGLAAVRFLSRKKWAGYVYIFLSLASTVLGTVIEEGIMWQWADLFVALMTVINVCCLFYGERRGELSALLL